MLFKDKYSSLAREFHSPIGNYGAVLWLAIFGMNFIGILCDFNVVEIKCHGSYLLYWPYYQRYSISLSYIHGNKTFSQEEKDQLFKAYLINANTKTRQIMTYCFDISVLEILMTLAPADKW